MGALPVEGNPTPHPPVDKDDLRQRALQYISWDDDPHFAWFLGWLLSLSTFALWWRYG